MINNSWEIPGWHCAATFMLVEEIQEVWDVDLPKFDLEWQYQHQHVNDPLELGNININGIIFINFIIPFSETKSTSKYRYHNINFVWIVPKTSIINFTCNIFVFFLFFVFHCFILIKYAVNVANFVSGGPYWIWYTKNVNF